MKYLHAVTRSANLNKPFTPLQRKQKSLAIRRHKSTSKTSHASNRPFAQIKTPINNKWNWSRDPSFVSNQRTSRAQQSLKYELRQNLKDTIATHRQTATGQNCDNSGGWEVSLQCIVWRSGGILSYLGKYCIDIDTKYPRAPCSSDTKVIPVIPPLGEDFGVMIFQYKN